MKRRRLILLAGCVVAVALALAGAMLAMRLPSSGPNDRSCRVVDRQARIWPEYADVTIPPNIAPLNFYVDEPGTRYCARIASTRGDGIEVFSDDGKMQIPLPAWQALLQANRGEKLRIDVYVRSADGAWSRFGRITDEIAPEDIDPYLVYRFLPPLYTRIWDINIYRRNLGNFEVTPVLQSESVGGCCLNCHSYSQGSPDSMLIQLRSKEHGFGPVVCHGGKVFKLDTMTHMKAAPMFAAWHPSGEAIAFSVNTVRQFYHTIGDGRDVLDLASRLVLYRFDTNRISSCPALNNPDHLSTSPAWSSDGRYLYYCSRPKTALDQFRDIRYDLMRIPYDIGANAWGQPEMILASAQTGKSIANLRISPDGRYLMFTMFDYGNWPIYQASSDLYLMDLQTRQYRPMELNSPQSESWHAFSGNGRWIVFSSKQRDGLLARPYFCYFDAQGRERKPFLLPQEDPRYYDGLVRTFNMPELISSPGQKSENDLVAAIMDAPPLVAEVDPSALP